MTETSPKLMGFGHYFLRSNVVPRPGFKSQISIGLCEAGPLFAWNSACNPSKRGAQGHRGYDFESVGKNDSKMFTRVRSLAKIDGSAGSPCRDH